MKKLLLLSALLIFACSNSNSEPTNDSLRTYLTSNIFYRQCSECVVLLNWQDCPEEYETSYAFVEFKFDENTAWDYFLFSGYPWDCSSGSNAMSCYQAFSVGEGVILNENSNLIQWEHSATEYQFEIRRELDSIIITVINESGYTNSNDVYYLSNLNTLNTKIEERNQLICPCNSPITLTQPIGNGNLCVSIPNL